MKMIRLKLFAVGLFGGFAALAFLASGSATGAQTKKDDILQTVASYKAWQQVHEKAKEGGTMVIPDSAVAG